MLLALRLTRWSLTCQTRGSRCGAKAGGGGSGGDGVRGGVTRLQAVVRGRHVRRLLACHVVQQHIATLAEVKKLATQFHRDILADNIKKGDIDFHRALFHQVCVAECTLIYLNLP